VDTLTEWESWSHFAALFAASAYLRGECPPSLLLVGAPAQGKTALLARFAHWPGVASASDVTASGVRDLLQADARARVLHMPELQRVLGHHPATVEALVSLLLSLLTGEVGRELVGPEAKGARADLSGRSLALFSAIPLDVLRLRQREFLATGLLSRLTLLSLRRSQAETVRVTRNIVRRDRSDLRPYPAPPVPNTPDGLVEIRSTRAADGELQRWIDDAPPRDARGVVLLTVLARAVAFLCGRDRVTPRDVAQLRAFAPYLGSLSFDLGAVTPREVLPLTRRPAWVE